MAITTTTSTCPAWCRSDHDLTTTHWRITHWHKRFDEWEQADAVQVRQDAFADDEGDHLVTQLSMRTGRPRLPDEFPPIGGQLTVVEARGLRDGLAQAIALLEAMALTTCPCGEPLVDPDDADRGRCGRCQILRNIATRRAERSRLRIVGA